MSRLEALPFPAENPTAAQVFQEVFPLSRCRDAMFLRDDVPYFMFTNMNEDGGAEAAILSKVFEGKRARVLCIASAGETPALLCANPNVAQLDAVDLNPRQVQLTKFRFQCLRHLTVDEMRCLFATDVKDEHSREAAASARVKVYDKLRSLLDPDTRSVFDTEARADVKFGLAFAGRAEQFYATLRQLRHDMQCSNLFSRDYWEAASDFSLLNCNFRLPPESAAKMETGWNTFGWLQGLVDLELKLERKAGSVDGTAELLSRNFYAKLMMDGAVAGTDVPLCLTPTCQTAVNERLGSGKVTLDYHVGSVYEVALKLADQGAQFDLIHLSNCPDFSPTFDATVAAIKPLVRALAPGGCITLRTCLVGVPGPAAVLQACGLKIRPDVQAIALANENSLLFNSVNSLAVAFSDP